MRIALSREPGAGRDVSPLELFFDLVYVFAIGQLSPRPAPCSSRWRSRTRSKRAFRPRAARRSHTR